VTTRYDPDRAALAELLADEPSYRVDQLWQGLYRDIEDPAELSTLPKALRHQLAEQLPAALDLVTRQTSDDGATDKFLWRLHDGRTIETVLMRYPDRATVCISSQAGCAMACEFCATGQAGFDRHLTVGEIVEQVAHSIVVARPRRVSNIVFMGMGEPLANLEPTLAAAHRIHDAFGISARHITISTVGLIPGIRRLSDEPLPVNLAVSLHAANDELRDRLVPINRRYPLADLHAACGDYVAATHRRLSFEWAMIDGVNDTPDAADELGDYARSLRAHVNLIPLNRTDGTALSGSPPAIVDRFRDHLSTMGVNVTVRANRGTDIDAACGQLRARTERSHNPAAASPVALKNRDQLPH
jgi:23S rRNA (adenine2503-C2)-methyltransferase